MKLKTLVSLSLITLVASLGLVAHTQTFSVIHTFTGTAGDGAVPVAGVTLRGSALFGTTWYGGIGGVPGGGTVYQMTHVGSAWNYSSLFLFPNGGEGGELPRSRILFGPDYHLYSTTEWGALAPTTARASFSTSHPPYPCARLQPAPGART